MIKHRYLLFGSLWAALLTGCGPSAPTGDLVFVDGRAVAVAGDSLLAITRSGENGIVLRDRETGAVYNRGEQALVSPHHVQEHEGRWYVSDVQDGAWLIAVFSPQWEVERRVRVDSIATAPHQFAVLPDGRIVIEAPEGRLLALEGDSVTTFALTEVSSRTGLLLGALGGVLHTVPDRSITLYNEAGNIRWRLQWPFEDGVAYVTDVAVDAQRRMHVLAGQERSNLFYAYTLERDTGQVIRWSVPGPAATFVVGRLGQIEPDSASRWIPE